MQPRDTNVKIMWPAMRPGVGACADGSMNVMLAPAAAALLGWLSREDGIAASLCSASACLYRAVFELQISRHFFVRHFHHHTTTQTDGTIGTIRIEGAAINAYHTQGTLLRHKIEGIICFPNDHVH